MLGWNDGTEQEIFSKQELVEKFSIERVHNAGAKFDYEKAKWFNHEWIRRSTVAELRPHFEKILIDKGIFPDPVKLEKISALVKDRCVLLTDFYDQSFFFFSRPENYDLDAVRPKWSEAKTKFFRAFIDELNATENWEAAFIEDDFKKFAALHNIKPGELQLPLRIMLVGGKFGPPVFEIAATLGKQETIERIQKAIGLFN